MTITQKYCAVSAFAISLTLLTRDPWGWNGTRWHWMSLLSYKSGNGWIGWEAMCPVAHACEALNGVLARNFTWALRLIRIKKGSKLTFLFAGKLTLLARGLRVERVRFTVVNYDYSIRYRVFIVHRIWPTGRAGRFLVQQFCLLLTRERRMVCKAIEACQHVSQLKAWRCQLHRH